MVGGLKRRESSTLFHKSLLEDISSQDSTKSTEIDTDDDEFAPRKRNGATSKRHKRENDADVTDSIQSSSEGEGTPTYCVAFCIFVGTSCHWVTNLT